MRINSVNLFFDAKFIELVKFEFEGSVEVSNPSMKQKREQNVAVKLSHLEAWLIPTNASNQIEDKDLALKTLLSEILMVNTGCVANITQLQASAWGKNLEIKIETDEGYKTLVCYPITVFKSNRPIAWIWISPEVPLPIKFQNLENQKELTLKWYKKGDEDLSFHCDAFHWKEKRSEYVSLYDGIPKIGTVYTAWKSENLFR